MTEEFDHTVGIYELDIYGHANHVQFLNWLEEGRERLLRGKGLSFVRLGERDRRLVIVNVHLDYLASVVTGETVRILTSVEKIGRSSVRFGHRIQGKDGRPVLEGSVTMVFIDGGSRPQPVPEDFRKAFGPGDRAGG
jgi:YbgC/YbaW family acyl-CoA thioester hydrolase